MSDAIPEGMKRVERPDLSTIRGRLQSWIDNPAEGEGSYIDTLEPLVQDMLAEQREICANTLRGDLAGVFVQVNPVLINTLTKNCLNAIGGNDEIE